MKRIGTTVLVTFAVLSFLVPAVGRAQDHYTYTVSALGGVGGSLGEDGAGVDNPSFGLGLSLLREDRVHVSLRLMQIDFKEEDLIGNLSDASLSYVVAGGEYRSLESYFESGFFVGLGGYDLEGVDSFGITESETGVGLVVGVTGEFEVNRRFGFLVEILGHLTSLAGNSTFVTGNAGIAVHF